MADNTADQMRLEMAEMLRQFNEHIDATINQ